MNHNERTKLQNDAINLLELIEDTSEHFCDEHFVSGEQFYIMMKALVDCKLKEFPFDLEDLEDEIYEDDDNVDWTNNIDDLHFEEDN
tara:strand:- start:279 stop:539 length:261 start_codon:yes stop_codon:yes gene_type:complete